MYDDSPSRMGLQILRGDPKAPVERLPGQPTPCRWCPKIPDGAEQVRTSAVEISQANWLAYTHYLECRAIGTFPDDPIVRRDAAIIRNVEDESGRLADFRGQVLAFSAGFGRGS
jgi:hypothetical protein